MKKFFKGFSIQLGINLFLHILRILIAFFIIKYAPESEEITSFAKDSGWQILSLFSIIGYNIISFIILCIKNLKNNPKFCFGFLIESIIGFICALSILNN